MLHDVRSIWGWALGSWACSISCCSFTVLTHRDTSPCFITLVGFCLVAHGVVVTFDFDVCSYGPSEINGIQSENVLAETCLRAQRLVWFSSLRVLTSSVNQYIQLEPQPTRQWQTWREVNFQVRFLQGLWAENVYAPFTYEDEKVN